MSPGDPDGLPTDPDVERTEARVNDVIVIVNIVVFGISVGVVIGCVVRSIMDRWLP